MDLEALVAEARERRPRPLPARERAIFGTVGVAYLGAAAGLAAAIPHDRPLRPLVAAGVTLLYALTRRTRFEVGSGVATPTALALVPMLFVAPLQLVPLLILLAEAIAIAPELAVKRLHRDRALYTFADSLYVLGPVAVLGFLAPGPPVAAHTAIYLLAAVAMALIGMANAVLGERFIYGIPMRNTLPLAGWAYGIGSILLPVAYMTARAAVADAWALLAIVPLLWLLGVFSKEREERYAAALELNQAYRGTVMVLADVVEADDNYTAFHCRGVVELSSAVGKQLGLAPAELQELEMAALLHDVGKIAIPKEILNKPSRLTEAEFELMKTHTVEGQALLDRIGGRLARIGKIVRSCHERWDGRGYPDGTMGEETPLAARIVFCCDAYSAMTTNRPYRDAMSEAEAIEELRRNAGSQFEPRLVAAVVEVVTNRASYVSESYNDAVRAVLASHPSPAMEYEAAAEPA